MTITNALVHLLISFTVTTAKVDTVKSTWIPERRVEGEWPKEYDSGVTIWSSQQPTGEPGLQEVETSITASSNTVVSFDWVQHDGSTNHASGVVDTVMFWKTSTVTTQKWYRPPPIHVTPM